MTNENQEIIFLKDTDTQTLTSINKTILFYVTYSEDLND